VTELEQLQTENARLRRVLEGYVADHGILAHMQYRKVALCECGRCTEARAALSAPADAKGGED